MERSFPKFPPKMDSFMGESITLLSAQLGFLNTQVAIIRIPLEAYPLFVQPMLQLILHNDQLDEEGSPLEPHRPWMYWHPFVHISITPNECSVVCPWTQAETLFEPVIARLAAPLRQSVTIRPDQYSVIMIGGPGMDAGARVLDLSSPLAMAGIPISFITSYYSDFILVPHSARTRVIRALEDRGFVFEADTHDGEGGHMTNPSSPLSQAPRPRIGSFSSSSLDCPPACPSATTPPATSIAELQIKTFALLKRHGISPVVHEHIDLVTCGGCKDVSAHTSAANFTSGKLQLGLVKCLTSAAAPPHFFSLTLTDGESLSVTLEKHLADAHFHNGGEDLLLGKDGPAQVPVTFDLHQLPRESTGIVCGVAARLTEGMARRRGGPVRHPDHLFNMSYLSTATAGHVILYRDELADAMEALEGLGEDGSATNGLYGG